MFADFDSHRAGDGRLAWDDLVQGIGCWRLWGAMAWQDVRNRYRRSLLGPLWLTLSTAILACSLALVYGRIFGISLPDYLGYLCISLAVWSLMSSALIDGCNAFLTSEHTIKHIKIPYFAYVLRSIWRNLIIFFHNIIVFVVVIALFDEWPGFIGLLFIPGIALLLMNIAWISVFLGVACSKFRDIPPIMANAMQLFFLVTPIMWKPEALGDQRELILFNPVYHLLEICRAPLLGTMPTTLNWMVSIAAASLGTAVTFLLYARFRRMIAYWL
ncbi:ABC transporter permease [Azospirillum halopraeferens]|uniref:ABC transporter permease n=1 Tax=Azospirillum halopraeferens TaxID=34010 RepID=UPI000491EF8A|nr:ABC transporter permease [Azospirillum halopraeferens]